MPLNLTGATTCSFDKHGVVEQKCDGRDQCIFNATASFLGSACQYTKKLELAFRCESCELNQRRRRRRRYISESLPYIKSSLNAGEVVQSPHSHNSRSKRKLKVSRAYVDLSKNYRGKHRQDKLKQTTKYRGGCPHPAFQIKHLMTINTDTLEHAQLTAHERAPLRADIHSVGTNRQSLFYGPRMTYIRQGNICKFGRPANKYDCVRADPDDDKWTCAAMGRERAEHHVHTGHYFVPRRY